MVRPITKLKQGQVGRIVAIKGPVEKTSRFTELGLSINKRILVLERLLFGGSLVVASPDGKYALRSSEAADIHVELLPDTAL